MLTLADRIRKFWCAAYFIRRAPDRDHTNARKVLRQVSQTTTGTVHNRAVNLLSEINDKYTEPPSAG